MANNPNNLALIQTTQSQKETAANELINAVSPSSLYGRFAQNSGGLIWGYYGGTLKLSTGDFSVISNGTITLTTNAINYIEADISDGSVHANTTAFSVGMLPLYQVTVNASNQTTAWTDYRQALLTPLAGGVNTFLELTDAIHSYSGLGSYKIVVKADETGLEAIPDTAGATAFIGLTDAPHSYTGEALKGVRVNTTEDGIEFFSVVYKSTDLSDFPSSYTGQAHKYFRVNATEDGVELVTGGGGGGVDYLAISSDFPDETATAGASTSMSIGPNSSTSEVASTSHAIDSSTFLGSSGTPGAYLGSFSTSDTIPEISSGVKVIVSGFPNTGPKTYGNFGTSTDPSATIILDSPHSFSVGQSVTLAGAANPALNGTWVISDRALQSITLTGFSATTADLGSATITGVVTSPNGIWTVAFNDPSNVYFDNWFYCTTTGDGGSFKLLVGHNLTIGQNATNSGNNSVSLGPDTANTEDNVVAIGGRKISQLVAGYGPGYAVEYQQLQNAFIGVPYFFTQLYDAPNSYTGFGGYKVVVKSDETGLEFVVDGGGGASKFTDLTDVPNSYATKVGQMLVVNSTETGLEYKAPVTKATQLTDFPTTYNNAQIVTGGSSSFIYRTIGQLVQVMNNFETTSSFPGSGAAAGYKMSFTTSGTMYANSSSPGWRKAYLFVASKDASGVRYGSLFEIDLVITFNGGSYTNVLSTITPKYIDSGHTGLTVTVTYAGSNGNQAVDFNITGLPVISTNYQTSLTAIGLNLAVP